MPTLICVFTATGANGIFLQQCFFDGYRNSVTYTDEDFKKTCRFIQKNFRLPLAMFSSNTMALNYASDTLNAGIRVDGTMNPGERDEHLKLKRFDGKNFAVAEWFAQPETFLSGRHIQRKKTYSKGKYSKIFRLSSDIYRKDNPRGCGKLYFARILESRGFLQNVYRFVKAYGERNGVLV
ncbi:MAG: hypothetical protein L6V93_16980 [Clostridiales bacterium]|nr:MAG: hypothetical protein L6V93_16980 [Clostridiales bacterium]